MARAVRFKSWASAIGIAALGFVGTLVLLRVVQRPPMASYSLPPTVPDAADDSMDDIPPKVDGAVTPDKIPDETAELFLLRVLSPGADNKRLRAATGALTAVLGLRENERSGLIDKVLALTVNYKQQVELKDETVTAAKKAGDYIRADQLQQERRELLAAFTAEIAKCLGPDGRVRVKGALDHIKAQTRIFGQ